VESVENPPAQPEIMDEYVPTILLPEPDSPVIAEFREKYAAQHPGINFVFDPLELKESADLLKSGKVDAVIVGAAHPSKEVFLTAIHEIGAVDKFASSFFIMEKPGKPNMYLADCAVNRFPNSEQLVRIAEQTVDNVRLAGDEPVVAFISYSTFGSGGDHEEIKKVSQAADAFRAKHPDVVAYGEIQWDAARNEEIYKTKNQGHGFVDGKKPNVFIFPNLETGNTVYKVLQDDADYTAIGPLIQGLEGDADFHDLSRGVTALALGSICEAVAKRVIAHHHEGEAAELPLAA
jgi:phosphate acetyltransferase